MPASVQISRIRRVQGALSVLGLLFINSEYPNDAIVRNGDTYDYIVVGGGTAGLVVAGRLVEANFSVLIIEAGANPGVSSRDPGLVTYTKSSRMDWNFTSETDYITDRCHKTGVGSFFGKVLGGSGTINYMIYERGNPRDYELFCKASNDSSWKWENMLKYFKKSENLTDSEILNSSYKEFHGTKGRIGVMKEHRSVCDDFLKGFKKAGEAVVTDNVGPGILGYSTALYNIHDGERSSTATAYLLPLKSNPKLHVTKNSLATQIIFDKDKNAVGVKYVKKGKTITVKVNNEVIVSAGPIKSPQLLMLSGIGPKEQLERMQINVLSNIPVGKNLQNAVGVLLGFKTNRKAAPPPFHPHDFPTPLIIGYSALNKSSSSPNFSTFNFIIDDFAYLLSFCGFTQGFKNSICDRLHMSADNNQMLLTNIININPKSRGQILLHSTDPHDQPKIIKGYYSHNDDLDATVEYIQDYMKTVGTPYFQNLGLEFLEATQGCSQFEFGSREYWRCYALCMVASTGRHTGTCSMGSVVDNKLCVYGVKKLRVVDASVMPNTLGGAIFAPEVALAEKAAEMIIEDGKEYC